MKRVQAKSLYIVPLLALVAGMVQGCSGQDEGDELIMTAGTGSFRDANMQAYMEPFSKETGVHIEPTLGGGNPLPMIEQQVESGNVQWDIVDCPPALARAYPDLFEPIDRSIVKSTANDLVYPEFLGERYAPYYVEAFPVLGYSKKAFPDAAPSTWADFFDTAKFPGPRGIPNLGLETASRLPAIALLADGVAPDDLVPLDLDRAYAKLDELKDDIRVVWTGFNQSRDILRSGEVVMNAMADGPALELMAADESSFGVSFKDGFRSSRAFCVPKGAPNKENAFRFIDYVLSHPEQQAVFTSKTGYGPPTKQGVESSKKMGTEQFTSLYMNDLIPDSAEWDGYVYKNSDALLDRWNSWIESI